MTELNDQQPQQSGVKITGNIPPELLARMQKTENQSTMENPVLPATQFKPAPAPSPVASSNSSLNNILDKLRKGSSVYEEILLPSKGRFYDGTDGPTDGILHIRPMTGEEEQILATPRFVRKGTAINMIFSRCIQEPIKPENLLSADRTFLLIYFSDRP